jgi:hypothetical protein
MTTLELSVSLLILIFVRKLLAFTVPGGGGGGVPYTGSVLDCDSGIVT